MKCFRILPEMCARTWCLFSSSSTLNMAFGSDSTTVASTSMASSFFDNETPHYAAETPRTFAPWLVTATEYSK